MIISLFHKFQDQYYSFETNTWKLRGYELMKAAEAFQKNWPEVQLQRCDDAHCMNSYLVLFPEDFSRRGEGWKVVYIPQNSQEPACFYLDGKDSEQLLQRLLER